LRAFERAIDIGIQVLECDIWITKDDKLVIMHGGDNGELPKSVLGQEGGPPEEREHDNTDFIFNYTYVEIQEHHKKTKYFLESP
jgi:glycerophosphoryl diester phosphodiesterase